MNDDLSQPTNQNKNDDLSNIKSNKLFIKNGSKTSVDLNRIGQTGEKDLEGGNIRGNDSLDVVGLISQESQIIFPETLDSLEIGCITSTNSQILGENGRQNTSSNLPLIHENPENDLGIPCKMENVEKMPEKRLKMTQI